MFMSLRLVKHIDNMEGGNQNPQMESEIVLSPRRHAGWLRPWLSFAIIWAPVLSACSTSVASAPLSRAASCGACHALHSEATAGIYPILAGQHSVYMQAQLKAFRDGTRTNSIMKPMARDLSDAEIAALSDYFESLGSGSEVLRR